MIKEIKYNGFTETPSDYECPDGDLATVSGLVPEDEALHPVLPPNPVFTLPDEEYTVCFVHVNTGYKHYIIRRDYDTTETVNNNEVTHHHSDFFWIDENDVTSYVLYTYDNATGKIVPHGSDPDLQPIAPFITFTDMENIHQVNSIGNTLLFLTSDGMYYSLWKGDTDGYKNLGNHIPEAHISFGLQGQAAMNEEEFVCMDNDDYDIVKNEMVNEIPSFDGTVINLTNDDFIDKINETVLAKVNKFIEERSIEEGKFLFPFMVRYAYRLYDNQLIMHSAPVLMVTDSYMAPHCFIKKMWYHENSSALEVYTSLVKTQLGAMLYDLDYRVYNLVGQTFAQYLEDWKDIVKSVDIFISAPLYTYDQSGKIKSRSIKNFDQRGFGVFNIPDTSKIYSRDGVDTGAYSDYYTIPYMIDNYGTDATEYGDTVTIGKDEFDLPRFSDGDMQKKIRDCHTFYLLKSIPIEEVSTSRTKIELPAHYLDSLVNREAMSDDTESHDLLKPKYSFTYNSRLTIANISKQLMNPFHVEDMMQYTWLSQKQTWLLSPQPHVQTSDDNSDSTATYYLYVFIRENNKEMVIKEPSGYVSNMGGHDLFNYFFYPNPNAYKVVVEKVRGQSHTFNILPLTPHDFLNGAVYHEGWKPVPSTQASAPVETNDNTVDMPNKLYVSEVNNPFVFTAKGMRTVGVSQIIGIRPIIETVSASQYGQFKFYVFTMEGVWAYKVSDEGYLQEPQLATPDIVLAGGESITQMDGAVLFAAERGIMMLNGAKSTCISDIINSHSPFIPFAIHPNNDALPGLRSVCGEFLYTVAPVPFRTFIQDCRMLYDYPHQHIVIFSPTHTYAYVFSLKSKQWGMIPSSILSTVPDYPAAMAMVKANITPEVGTPYNTHTMVDYSKDPAATIPDDFLSKYPGLIITRPLKLDMPDVLKTVESVIQRGNFKKVHIQSILYASRDLQNWFLVKSSVDQYLRGFRGTPYKYFRIALLCQLDDDESIFGCSIQFNPRYQNQLR